MADELTISINKLINIINNNIINKIIINNDLEVIFNDIIKNILLKPNLNNDFLIKINTKNKCIKCNRIAEYINSNNENMCWVHSL